MSSHQKLVPYLHTDGKTWPHYFVDERSGIIYFEKKHNGKRVKFSTKVKSGVKARVFANAEFDRRIGKKKSHVRTLIKEELRAWVKVKESEDLDYDTLNNIRRAAKQIGEYWGDMLPDEITVDSAPLWYEYWQLKHSDISIENAVKYMNAFCRYLNQKVVGGQALLPAVPKFSAPDRKVRMIARKKKQERILTTDEFTKIFQAASSDEERIAALFMYTMAARVEETLTLDFDRTILLDQDVPAYRWFAGQNKADLVGEHALPSVLIPYLEALREVRKSQGTTLLFPQKINNQVPLKEQQIDWNSWRDRADLGWHWTSKIFRHTCLSNLFNDPRNPQATICKQYRVSLQVALETYVKTTRAAMLLMRDIIEVKI